MYDEAAYQTLHKGKADKKELINYVFYHRYYLDYLLVSTTKNKDGIRWTKFNIE